MDSWTDIDTHLLYSDSVQRSRPPYISPAGIPHIARSCAKGVRVGGERRRKRVVQLEEIRCVEAGKTERIVIKKAHPMNGCTGGKDCGGRVAR